MLYVLTHFGNHDISWVLNNPDGYVLYDRSESGVIDAIPRENIGDADFDKLDYLVTNYETLPDVFLWSKSNLFKFITPEEFGLVKDNTGFTPLLTKNHKTYSDAEGLVCYYEDGWYFERNNSWYLGTVPAKCFNNWSEWADTFHLSKPDYIPFAPGGSYLLTRERVRRHPKELYAAMRDSLPYSVRPGEAQLCERSYGLLWK